MWCLYIYIYTHTHIMEYNVCIISWCDMIYCNIDHQYNIYNGILLGHESHVATCNNINRPGGCYVKWNKSDKKIQTLYDIS